MALNTPHNVTLTEGSDKVIILCSLESKVLKYAEEDIKEVDTIFIIL